MPRYKLTIEYDGTDFVGWQVQDNGPSVQAEIERAIKRFTGEDVKVICSGRTDAGVHALGQVIHIDLKTSREPGIITDALNQHLKPKPIAVLDCEAVDDHFNARFSATKRHYVYRIINRRAPLTVMRDRCWHVVHDLDAKTMHDTAQSLVGHHDLTTFRSVRCQAKSPMKTIDEIEIIKCSSEVIMKISARSFMHNQVRSIIGSLKLVGCGKWSPDDLVKALEAKDRAYCGTVAPVWLRTISL